MNPKDKHVAMSFGQTGTDVRSSYGIELTECETSHLVLSLEIILLKVGMSLSVPTKELMKRDLQSSKR
jgi:hypothetical protein